MARSCALKKTILLVGLPRPRSPQFPEAIMPDCVMELNSDQVKSLTADILQSIETIYVEKISDQLTKRLGALSRSRCPVREVRGLEGLADALDRSNAHFSFRPQIIAALTESRPELIERSEQVERVLRSLVPGITP